jgi:DNA-binding response OmpR family regulator
VVEDDQLLRQKLNTKTVLVHAGYLVDVAEDGAAAWDALQANRYDLLITDNNMPEMSGMELLKKLRSARMELPVIMATGTCPHRNWPKIRGLNPSPRWPNPMPPINCWIR